MQSRRLTLLLPMIAGLLAQGCSSGPGSENTTALGSQASAAVGTLKALPLDESGEATLNLLRDPGFETNLSGFTKPSDGGSIERTKDAPIEGEASLRVSLEEPGARALWRKWLPNTTVRGAGSLTVRATVRALTSDRGTAQLCAEATYESGDDVRECVRLPRREGRDRKRRVTVELDTDRVLKRVAVALEHVRKAPCLLLVDEVSAVLNDPLLRSSSANVTPQPEVPIQPDAGPAADTATPEPQPEPQPEPIVPEPIVPTAPLPVGETMMHSGSFFYRNIAADPKHPDSDRTIAWMSQSGNSFDPSGQVRIDLSLKILTADDSAPLRTFSKTEDFFTVHCDDAAVPIPAGGALESNPAYSCDDDGDCHLLVFHRPSQLLYEMWRAHIPNGAYDGPGFNGGCLAVWDAQRNYGLDGRGANCTSADAAGFPIAPMLFTPEEVQSGEIRHALRLILPNRNIRRRTYVPPATHSTSATTGPAEAPPYGALFRLKPSFDMSKIRSEGGKVVARALQQYGMYIADGGSIAMTGSSDHLSSVKWCDHSRYEYCDDDPNRLLHENDLIDLRIGDFDMIYTGPETALGDDCERLYPTPTP